MRGERKSQRRGSNVMKNPTFEPDLLRCKPKTEAGRRRRNILGQAWRTLPTSKAERGRGHPKHPSKGKVGDFEKRGKEEEGSRFSEYSFDLHDGGHEDQVYSVRNRRASRNFRKGCRRGRTSFSPSTHKGVRKETPDTRGMWDSSTTLYIRHRYKGG